MTYNTFSFFLFLPLVFLLHYYSHDKFRWLVLLIASLLFYSALQAPHLIIVLSFVTTVTYFAGIFIDGAGSRNAKKIIFISGISFNVLTLLSMKYHVFIVENINILLSALNLRMAMRPGSVFLTIGISYFVFQALSYLIDIYLEVEKPERNFGKFALYMSFFPKLLQGPIERAGHFIPQLATRYEIKPDSIMGGLVQFSWGLFKKAVVADRLALLVDPVYDNPFSYKGVPLLFATYIYAFQIYFDFSGYTDMALGVARLFGIRLSRNFNAPYLATSIADFWRRWHISFSSWILDYIFKPLQILWRDWREWGTAAALVVTFTISGLWHGASWVFVAWGLLHGIYMAVSVFFRPYHKKISKYLNIDVKSNKYKAYRIFVTFNLVSFAWIFFRSADFDVAKYIIMNMFKLSEGFPGRLGGIGILAVAANISLSECVFILMLLALALTISCFWGSRLIDYDLEANRSGILPVVCFIVLMIITFGIFDDTKFIYFKF